MSEAYRRVILKPVGLGGSQLAQFASSVAAAVELQTQLASKSPHVLQFVSGVQETEHSFFVEHEPAQPLSLEHLFDPASPPAEAKTLLRMAVAIYDALRVAHGTPGPRPVVHGGLCPGVLLTSPDGVQKVTDFGFAPAICTALGSESYLNLAVGPRTQGPPETLATGVWEVLAREIVDRPDRLCSFIDPEKYAARMYQSFEPKSDIIAAGFILHLLAEHHHPYFHDDPDAHRMVEVAEYMAMGTATRARRKDLRESPDAAVRLWCELVGRMIDRVPQNRPTAAALAEEFGPHVRPVGLGDLLEGRLEALCNRLEQTALEEVRWEDVDREAKLIADAQTAPREVIEQANSVVQLSRTMALLHGDSWHEAAKPIADLSATAGLPPAVIRKAQQATEILNRNLSVRQELDRIEAAMQEAAQADQAEPLNIITSLQDQLKALGTGEALLLPLRTRLKNLGNELEARYEQAGTGVQERERGAREWLLALQTAVEARQWAAVEQRLANRPRLPRGLDDVRAQIAEIEKQVHHRGELVAQLRQADERIAGGNIADARRLTDPIERQTDHPDLAEEAHRLHERIEEEERRLLEQQRKIEEARARADGLLAAAEQDFKNDTWDSLHQAETCVAEALGIPEIAPPQRERGQKLRDAIAGRLKGMLAEAEVGVAELRKAEDDLRESRKLLDSGRFTKAEEKARPHVRSSFPDMQQEAERMVAEIADALARYRGTLRQHLEEAGEHLRQGRFEQAINAAREVEKDEHAGDAFRTEARQTIGAAQVARKTAEEARLKAIADRDQALAVLRDGGVEGARTYAQSVLNNPHAGADVRADADQVLNALPGIEAAKALMDGEDFPGAQQAFDEILRAGEAAVWPPARAAAERLKSRAGQLRKEKLVDSIHKHLSHRAEREEASPNVDIVPPDESLPASAPVWVRTSLTNFETFLHDCAITGKPARAGKELMPGNRLGEKYEILEFLGRGGMGEVYRARDLSLDREVALKLAAPAAENSQLAEALRNEAKAIAALTHPHIIHINSFDVIEDRPCFDTNYIRGRDLDQHASQHALSWREMGQILIPIAEALAYAHKQGVLHRDVKPQNIYLGERPTDGPWLIDFGLARMRSLCDRRANTGLCGTPGFIAPEVITSMGEEVDHRADIFALGCVLYGLLAKEPPFRRGALSAAPSAPSISRTLLNTLRSQTVPLAKATPNAPDTLRQICERAMAHEPQDRYQDAGEMARELRRFLLQLDQQEAETVLAQARERLDERPRKEPAELGALDEVRTLADNARSLAEEARRRAEQTPELTNDALSLAIGEVKRHAVKLVEDTQRLKQQIVASQAEASRQLQTAGDGAAAGRFRAALAAARTVLANPYVPDLHDEARKLVEQAERQVRAAVRKAAKLAAGVACVLAVVSVVCWYGFLATSPPKVTLTPKNTVVNVGETATLTVQATGRPKPRYQWQRKTGEVWNNLAGKTQPSLSIGPVQREDAGEYQCVVSNGKGPDQKPAATLSVKEQAPPAQFGLSLQKHGEGSVELSPQSERYAKGTQVTLTAKPADGWRFDHWEGDLTGKEARLALGMDKDRSVTAVFVQAPVLHALTTQAKGLGSVNVAPPGERYAKGTQVTLTAKPADGWRFDHWEGDLTGTETQLGLTLDKDKSVTAVFAQVPSLFALATQVKGLGLIETVPPGERHAKGTRVALTAYPAEGWRFDHWEGDLTGKEAQLGLAMDKDRSVTAVFVKAPAMLALATQVKGLGLVDVAPAGKQFVKGTEVTLTANPAQGWRFDRWDGDPAVQGNPVKVKVEKDTTLTAVFMQSGWPTLDEATGGKIKSRLVDKQSNTSPLKGSSPDWVHLKNQGGKLYVEMSYPGYGQAFLRPAVPIPFPNTEWPANADQQPAKAAETIAAALQQAAGSDPALTAAIKYFASWDQRVALEHDLVAELSAGASGPVNLDAAKLSGKSGYLTRLARIKWMSGDVPDTPGLGVWTPRLQDVLSKNRNVQQVAIQVRPTRFIEYFWGPEFVHAIYWFADQPGSAIVRYTRLGPSAELGAQVREFVANKVSPSKLGDRLLGPILRDAGGEGRSLNFFTISDPRRSFGFALAPDGPLCFMPMLRLPFDPMPVNLSVPDAAVISDVPRHLAGSITQLDALFKDVFKTAHTAAWVLVSLGAAPPPDKALTPTDLWEVPGEMLAASGVPGEALTQQRLAAVQSIHDFGRAYNADVICFKSDQVAVTNTLRTGIRAVDSQFNQGTGGESFDAGFLYPRVGDAQAPWLMLVANPVEAGK